MAAIEKALTDLAVPTGTTAEKTAAAAALASAAKAAGLSALVDTVIDKLKTLANDKKNAPVREGAILAFAALSKEFGHVSTPYLIPQLPFIIEKGADAVNVRAAVESATKNIVSSIDPNGVLTVIPYLFEAAQPKLKWQSRVIALSSVGSLAQIAPAQTTAALPEIIPLLSSHMGDARAEVSKAAEDSLLSVCSVVGNKDIEPFIPVLVSCIARPSEVSECVYKLSATTFVQAVEPPTLAIIVPVLERGLKERSISVQRKVALIIDNMCRLVEVPSYAAPFLPKLLPGLERAKEEVSDPECREVANRAYNVLLRAAGEDGSKNIHGVEIVKATPEEVKAKLLESLSGAGVKSPAASLAEPVITYITSLAVTMSNFYSFEEADWVSMLNVAADAGFSPKDKVVEAAKAFVKNCFRENVERVREEDDEEGDIVCDCEFSLAYGAKILLNNARLRLLRGHRYGICGHNGCGKSTLMRSIANGQVENFPDPEEVRTVYVEHDIQADDADKTVVEYVMTDKRLQDKDEIVRVLGTLGFTNEMIYGSILALSGGWKMKLALARAMLLKADIMLLDEPTNHLDKINVAWLVNYLNNLTNVTCLIVSHDASFLDAVCTNIIHYETFKLRTYKGNLSEFVRKVPEAQSYYELDATPISFKFPEPGYLEGINSKGKAIMKMTRIGFKYPNTERMVLTGVTINLSLSSRVVVVGANGAGKSTMIKLLTNELIPTEGTVWKHPNLRIAYVAQHAFHHIEKHLDKSPSEYIQWRYASGEDKEALTKAASALTEEEEKKMAEKVTIDGEKFVVEQVVSRRRLKSSWEYEVKFVGLGPEKNQWLPRKWLEDQGFGKMVDALDAREAAMAGLHAKPLTAQNIAKHLADVGLEAEFSLHSRMRGLSGGQKVKVVLGAAMWNNPHMLILDEPTNYLDRDSLGAFANAIKDFGGGVVMITHNAEFANAICSETWLVEGGKLNVSGESWTRDTKIEEKELDDEVIDAAGNVIKVEKKVKLSKSEMKRRIKARLKKEAQGLELSDEEPWMEEMRKEMGL